MSDRARNSYFLRKLLATRVRPYGSVTWILATTLGSPSSSHALSSVLSEASCQADGFDKIAVLGIPPRLRY